MKKAVVLIVSLVGASVFTWTICGYYLDELLHAFIPNMNHDEYTDYWFYSFLLIEVFILFIVTFFITKWKK